MLVIDSLESISVEGFPHHPYKYLKQVADQLGNKSFVSRRQFFLMLKSLFIYFEREREVEREENEI